MVAQRTEPASNKAKTVLQVAGISVRFGGLHALDDVDLHVDPGALVSLIGPNGAGKTTLFNVISGFQEPNAGTVWLHGEDVTRLPPAVRAQRGIVRTFQRMQLFEDLNVRDNLLASRECERPLRLLRGAFELDRVEPSDVEDAEEVGAMLGLLNVFKKPVTDLSTGARRLVELGRCMMTSAPLLLLDEPSSGLDHAETERFIDVVRSMHELQAGRQAILLVEHDMSVALGLAHYVFVLDFGQLIAEGTPAEIRANERVQNAYLGREG